MLEEDRRPLNHKGYSLSQNSMSHKQQHSYQFLQSHKLIVSVAQICSNEYLQIQWLMQRRGPKMVCVLLTIKLRTLCIRSKALYLLATYLAPNLFLMSSNLLVFGYRNKQFYYKDRQALLPFVLVGDNVLSFQAVNYINDFEKGVWSNRQHLHTLKTCRNTRVLGQPSLYHSKVGERKCELKYLSLSVLILGYLTSPQIEFLPYHKEKLYKVHFTQKLPEECKAKIILLFIPNHFTRGVRFFWLWLC